ncbi:MAG: two-component regulator propeller domain-containing protein [Agriterribacter sp.]
MRLKMLLVCCGFLLQVKDLYCQDYRVLHWGVEDGLSQGINQKIIRDSQGFLWITSYEGLNRFDGKSFRNFYSFPRKRAAIHGTETTGLVEDALHKIWIGSGDGLNRYDPVADTVSVFFPEGKSGNYIIPIAATDKEIICFDISGALTAFDMVTFKRRNIVQHMRWHNDYVSATNCWLDKTTNTLWMPAENGVAQIDIVSGKTDYHFQFLKINAVVYNVYKKQLVLGTDDGFFEWNMQQPEGSFITTALQTSNIGKVNCLATDKSHQLWIGTEQNGLFVVDTAFTVTHFIKTDNPANSIRGNKINSIYCDATGIVFTGIATNGIDQLLPGNRFQHFSENSQTGNSLNNNIIRCFLEDDNKRIWIATQGGGINIFNPLQKTFSCITKKNIPGLPFDFVRYMVNDKKSAWIGTEKGMCRMDMTTLATEKISFRLQSGNQLTDLYIEHIIAFTDSSWLIATKTQGLFELHKKESIAKQLPFLSDKHIFYIAFVNGLLFVSCWDGDQKLYVIENGKWTAIKKDITSFLITYVLYDEKQKKYLIGTLKGLLETDEQLNLLHQYTTEDGLSNNYVYALLQDEQSMLWISTNKGISRFNPSTHSFNIYTPSNGLQGYEYNAKACLKTSDNSLYFGGTNGFDIIKASAATPPFEKSRFYIKALLVNNIPFEYGNDINFSNSVHLSHSDNNITIQTATIDFIASGKSKIKYKLEEVDDAWKIADRDFVINYSGLQPGTYHFSATAADSNNNWNEKISSLTFIIAKPWWQTWWFRSILLLSAGGLTFFIIRAVYSSKLKKQKIHLEKKQLLEKERTRIATDMHDDLGAGLSRIRFLSEHIDLKQQMNQPIQEDIGKIKQYSHEMIDKMGEIVWALNERNDSLQDLVAYVRSYAMEYLVQNNIHCNANITEEMPVIFLSGEYRRNIFLAVKEALHNIVKHAKATEVIFQISISNQMVILIQDNGIGFSASTKKRIGNGIVNINSRMRAINGKADIQEMHGTIVQLTAPLPV